MSSSDPSPFSIISASRRTDIPAFHMDWLLARLREGYADIPNPRNPKQIRRVELTRDTVGCIIFWSKNPAPLLERIDELEAFRIPFGVAFTLNAYGTELEPTLPPMQERVATFQSLSARIGAERMVWRYDPIALSLHYDGEFHLARFKQIAEKLHGRTARCVVSFLDFYARTVRYTDGLVLYDPPAEERNALATELERIGRNAGIRLEACAEAGVPLPPASCIGAAWVKAICGKEPSRRKDSGQRPLCNCIRSIDIGQNDTCPHGCLYCYANRSPFTVKR